ncbi:hypothetical protein AN189_17615 [Loktanella sp. 3ANDIMAR09]|uniref:DnaT-like ssDNA-binding protein n=1 Tax=Loktanella sp. 3ANDIMAR09 TaxID=1225657 RepID=UPI0006FD37E4|nr:DnaT-like ssDNA-binding protein [Loktanella sp. 3ANDIMAR09]KQI67042.1 hypothetical protein AN189_17615 [Loktanella sp. 3ANDIMAR09]
MALDTTIGGTASDSYVTFAEFQAYWTARGVNMTQHGHDTSHEANLRSAAQYLDSFYRFVGMKQYQFQARAWPRLVNQLVDDWPIDPDTIPRAIKDAQMEMAYLIHEGATPFAAIDGLVKRKREKLDVIEEETEYFGGQGKPSYPSVATLLREYITGGPGKARMVRG